jgi:hypothetical protein
VGNWVVRKGDPFQVPCMCLSQEGDLQLENWLFWSFRCFLWGQPMGAHRRDLFSHFSISHPWQRPVYRLTQIGLLFFAPSPLSLQQSEFLNLYTSTLKVEATRSPARWYVSTNTVSQSGTPQSDQPLSWKPQSFKLTHRNAFSVWTVVFVCSFHLWLSEVKKELS